MELQIETGDTIHYWLYAAGKQATNWENDLSDGVMGIGWDELGDLSKYSSKDEIRARQDEKYGDQSAHTMSTHVIWQFVNEIKPGDIVFVKKGKAKIVGRGVVTGEFKFDETREGYMNTRPVKWTHQGEWDYPGQLPLKTLTDISIYKETVHTISAMFDGEEITDPPDELKVKLESYTKADFLSKVFMSSEQYDELRNLLLMKKNIILQGAPGVGKTFVAKRLAFSIIGERDESRVEMVQFHQSYSYEDFIMGYRPTEAGGFILKHGVFYEFCKQAEVDGRPFFFIIDEINRGNLSKIFGELFMLIENDKRGAKLRLLYADEEFSIPDNIHIIGMMNTADRSLAMLDYALRRRFSFYELRPAFDSDGFRAYQTQKGNAKFDRLILCTKGLNDTIASDESLGPGFCIGHSYFYTESAIDDAWLHAVVEFDLIPLLKEYWFDEPEKIQEWCGKLRGAIQ